jgi:hypothetical protein
VQVFTAGQAQGSALKVLKVLRRDKHAAEQWKRYATWHLGFPKP